MDSPQDLTKVIQSLIGKDEEIWVLNNEVEKLKKEVKEANLVSKINGNAVIFAENALHEKEVEISNLKKKLYNKIGVINNFTKVNTTLEYNIKELRQRNNNHIKENTKLKNIYINICDMISGMRNSECKRFVLDELKEYDGDVDRSTNKDCYEKIHIINKNKMFLSEYDYKDGIVAMNGFSKPYSEAITFNSKHEADNVIADIESSWPNSKLTVIKMSHYA